MPGLEPQHFAKRFGGEFIKTLMFEYLAEGKMGFDKIRLKTDGLAEMTLRHQESITRGIDDAQILMDNGLGSVGPDGCLKVSARQRQVIPVGSEKTELVVRCGGDPSSGSVLNGQPVFRLCGDILF